MNAVATKNRDFPRPDEMFQGCENAQAAAGADPVFYQWLTHHLGQLYDPVVSEPIPNSLLRLLEERLK